MQTFINCFKGEWIKKRRSFAGWLVWVGAFFIPVINTIIFLVYPKQAIKLHVGDNFWTNLFLQSWESMSLMLLPMGIVLAVSLITQVEFKNNTWKQLHTAPVPFTSIFFSKLGVLLIMLLQLFILFNIGIFISAVIPPILHSEIPFPKLNIPFSYILEQNGKFFLACFPLLALQYLISLQFKNFLIPIGGGLALVIGGLIALSWKYNYLIPSTYISLSFFESLGKTSQQHNILLLSAMYFLLLTISGYILYLFKKEKG